MKERNKEKKKKYDKQYHIDNKEKKIEIAKEWAKNNQEKRDKYIKKWKIDNPERKKELDRIGNLKRKYNITLEDYNDMLFKQDNKCFLCKIDRSSLIKNLCVDHNHITGQIRALLCDKCNSAIGLLKEDVDLLQKVINYINYFKIK